MRFRLTLHVAFAHIGSLESSLPLFVLRYFSPKVLFWGFFVDYMFCSFCWGISEVFKSVVSELRF